MGSTGCFHRPLLFMGLTPADDNGKLKDAVVSLDYVHANSRSLFLSKRGTNLDKRLKESMETFLGLDEHLRYE